MTGYWEMQRFVECALVALGESLSQPLLSVHVPARPERGGTQGSRVQQAP